MAKATKAAKAAKAPRAKTTGVKASQPPAGPRVTADFDGLVHQAARFATIAAMSTLDVIDTQSVDSVIMHVAGELVQAEVVVVSCDDMGPHRVVLRVGAAHPASGYYVAIHKESAWEMQQTTYPVTANPREL